jgi:inosine-uridine nucleoside N-ribohydrolase
MKYVTLFLAFCLLSATCSTARPPAAAERLSLIIDADTANEVDDLFALVRALTEPNFDLRGITSAQFHTSPLASDNSAGESQAINEELLQLMNRADLPHPLGANEPLPSLREPRPSAASQFIIEQAHALPAGKQLHLVILGSCTNVASAILQDPAIIPKVSVHYLGFWHDPVRNDYNKREFNSGNDTLAVELLLNTEGLEFDVMTATTSQHLVFTRNRVERELADLGQVGDYLMTRWNTFDRWWTKNDPEKNEWIMWDVALVEALARPDLATKQTYPTPPENTLRQIGVYTDINVEGMKEDYWARVE